MKELEWKLVCELMKNSRRSHRELARRLRVSQPTISRAIWKLEKEGIIKEYTIIPDYTKLGFTIMSLDFAKLTDTHSEQKLEEIRKQVQQTLMKEPISAIIAMSGIGCNADRVVVSLHEDYATYQKHLNKLRQHPLVEVDEIKSFLINLSDKSQFLPLTFSGLAGYIAYKKGQETGKHQDSDT